MKKYKKELVDLIATHTRNWQNIIKSTYRYIYDDIIQNTPVVFSNTTISTKVYCYLNDIEQLPTCKICGKQLDDINASVKNGFKGTCSNKKCKTAYKYQRTTDAVMKKYGVSNVYALKSVIDKTAQTKLQRYGSKTYNNSEKNKQTCLQKYGVENAAQTLQSKNNSQKTCLEKYGVKYSFQADSVKAKIKQTSLEKYGVDNPGCSEASLEKIKNTLQQHYGEDIKSLGDLLKIPEIKAKAQATTQRKYGVKYNSQSEAAKRQYKLTCLKKYGCSNHATYISYQILLNNEFSIPLFTLAELDKTSNDEFLNFKCKKCGKTFSVQRKMCVYKKCPDCYKNIKSFEELQVFDYIKSIYNGNILHNNRLVISPLELDIYIPEKNFAVEFDGLYYHQHDGNIKIKNYHLNKTLQCEKQGIQLIHVFENEWKLKQDIVKSRLKNLLGVYDKVIYARKCEVREVPSKESILFQEDNHLQGAVNAKVNLGLYFNGELISLMTFGKCRFDKKHEWEMLRFCSKLGYHVVGGAGKLLKHFEKTYQPKSLVSYADRRWSQGKLYKALGFKLNHASGPNYWYFKNLKLESRIKYQKYKLKDILEVFDESKTEVENMIANGYHMIYDCGNLVFEKTYGEDLQ